MAISIALQFRNALEYALGHFFSFCLRKAKIGGLTDGKRLFAHGFTNFHSLVGIEYSLKTRSQCSKCSAVFGNRPVLGRILHFQTACRIVRADYEHAVNPV